MEYFVANKKSAGQLTAKEIKVLSLLVDGLTNQEVAQTLSISTRTVEAHRARIMLRLNIHTLAGLVKYALQHKFTSIDQEIPT